MLLFQFQGSRNIGANKRRRGSLSQIGKYVERLRWKGQSEVEKVCRWMSLPDGTTSSHLGWKMTEEKRQTERQGLGKELKCRTLDTGLRKDFSCNTPNVTKGVHWCYRLVHLFCSGEFIREVMLYFAIFL